MDKITVRWKDNPTEYARQYKAIWRKENPEKARAEDERNRIKYKDKRNKYSRDYYDKHKDEPEFRKRRNVKSLNWYYKNKEKRLCQSRLNKAIKSGKIKRPDYCLCCLTKCVPEGHHDDYGKPLEVEWFCKECHENHHHQAVKEINKKIKKRLEDKQR